MSLLHKNFTISVTFYAVCVTTSSNGMADPIEIKKGKIYKVHKTLERDEMLFVQHETKDDYFGFYAWKFKRLPNQKVAKLLYDEQYNRLQN